MKAYRINLTTGFALVALGLTLLPRCAISQIVRDTTHWNDEELYQERPTRQLRFFPWAAES